MSEILDEMMKDLKGIKEDIIRIGKERKEVEELRKELKIMKKELELKIIKKELESKSNSNIKI